jgi:hypothetical protein
MKIRVIYPGRVGHVDPAELDRLLENGEIIAFERGRKLVVVGIHPTRKGPSKAHHTERRRVTDTNGR